MGVVPPNASSGNWPSTEPEKRATKQAEKMQENASISQEGALSKAVESSMAPGAPSTATSSRAVKDLPQLETKVIEREEAQKMLEHFVGQKKTPLEQRDLQLTSSIHRAEDLLLMDDFFVKMQDLESRGCHNATSPEFIALKEEIKPLLESIFDHGKEELSAEGFSLAKLIDPKNDFEVLLNHLTPIYEFLYANLELTDEYEIPNVHHVRDRLIEEQAEIQEKIKTLAPLAAELSDNGVPSALVTSVQETWKKAEVGEAFKISRRDHAALSNSLLISKTDNHLQASAVYECVHGQDAEIGSGAFNRVKILAGGFVRRMPLKTQADSSLQRSLVLNFSQKQKWQQYLNTIPHVLPMEMMLVRHHGQVTVNFIAPQCEGSYDELNHTFDFDTRLKHLGQAIECIANLHEKDIVHYDLKRQNLLVGLEKEDGTSEIYLSDFDTAEKVEKGQALEIARGTGTPEMLSPELKNMYDTARAANQPTVVLSESAGKQSEIFNLGIMAFEMLACHTTEDRQARVADPCGYFNQILQDPNYLRAAGSSQQKITDLIASMLDRDPTKRPTAAEVQARYLAIL